MFYVFGKRKGTSCPSGTALPWPLGWGWLCSPTSKCWCRVRGLITGRALVLSPGLIIRGFGMRAYLRCWYGVARACVTGRGCTFLECVW